MPTYLLIMPNGGAQHCIKYRGFPLSNLESASQNLALLFPLFAGQACRHESTLTDDLYYLSASIGKK